MDAFVNMGNVLMPVRCNYGSPKTGVLYTRSFRYTVPFTLVLSMGIIVTTLILGCLGTYQISSQNYNETPSVLAVSLFFYWCTIPIVALVGSVTEIVMLRRSTLTPLRLFIFTSITVALWVAASLLWASCTYSNGSCEWFHWPAFTVGPNDMLVPQNRFPLMVWFAIVAMALNLIRLCLAFVALRRQRKARMETHTKSMEHPKIEQHEDTESLSIAITPRSPPPSYTTSLDDHANERKHESTIKVNI